MMMFKTQKNDLKANGTVSNYILFGTIFSSP